VAELPRQRPARAPVDVELVTVVVRKGSDLLLERRPDAGRMAGMWQFPTAEPPGPDGRTSGLFPAALLAGLRPLEALGAIRHGITHHRIRVAVHGGRFRAEAKAPLAWVGTDAVSALPLTGMTKKILRAHVPDVAAVAPRR
jgi:adenine-specific DNA glycosylase